MSEIHFSVPVSPNWAQFLPPFHVLISTGNLLVWSKHTLAMFSCRRIGHQPKRLQPPCFTRIQLQFPPQGITAISGPSLVCFLKTQNIIVLKLAAFKSCNPTGHEYLRTFKVFYLPTDALYISLHHRHWLDSPWWAPGLLKEALPVR